jgi:hypothetical protein
VGANSRPQKERARRAQRPARRDSPSKVPALPAAAPTGSPRPALPLMKIRGSLEYSYATELRGKSGSPLPSRARPFSRPQRSLFVRRLPETCAPGFILLRAFRLLQSTATCSLPSVPRKTLRPSGSRRAPPLGFRPSSRHQPAASTRARDPNPAPSSVLDVSHVLDGLLRHQPLRACFIPQPRPGFALQGFVPLRGAVPGFPGRFHALLPLSETACGCPRQPPRPRLQGLAPRDECGAVRDRLKPRSIRSPPGLLLLRVTPPAHRRSAFTPLPPRPSLKRARPSWSPACCRCTVRFA